MNKDTIKKVANVLGKILNISKSAVVVISAAKVLIEAIDDLTNKIK